jgi:zinc transport system substrate-binding protein
VDVVVSILPQEFFVERIGGEHVNTTVLVAPGASPATYEPSPRQMAALENADVYFRIGMPFEHALLQRIQGAFPELTIVDAARDISLKPIDRFTTVGADDEQADGSRMDPHAWLDPDLAAKQAETIAQTLAEIAPDHAETFDRNLQQLKADLQQVDAEVVEILKPLEGEEILVFHPAYGYFADAYGLRQVAIEVEGKSPSTRQLSDILAHARENNIRAIFVQPQFSSTAAEAIADQIGGEIVELDPLAHDYPDNLRTMARTIAEVKSAGE